MGVQLTRSYRFTCDAVVDGRQCTAYTAQFVPPDGESKPLTWARKQAKEAQWVFASKDIYCPEHGYHTCFDKEHIEQLRLALGLEQ